MAILFAFVKTICLHVLQYKANENITLMTQGGKPCGLGNFVKFGGGTTLQHNRPMLVDTLSIVVSLNLVDIAFLPFQDLIINGQDIPSQTIGDAIGYIILWPWKFITPHKRI
jgi:hypothetical protein